MKDVLKKKFEEAYPDKRLLAIHLDGFSHSVIFDDGSKQSAVQQESYSAYSTEQKNEHFNTDNAIKVLSGIPHYEYQGNAIEYLYVLPNER